MDFASAELSDAGPGPSAKLTTAVKGLADMTEDFASTCRTLGPYSTTTDWKKASAQLEQVSAYMTTVTDELN
ncbi:hypothetical protein [Mycobacterium sp. 1164985.4]|uniref:hypothetical protein n=1 Tax=Mycobacterium sp. 1164985.4 TaxID=1834069 RepID=UPI0007FD570C|nr:hypothetical protein [Mycobacterium sp. 1164985.4]OBK78333.1 hypothetical protein A5650_10800 [Mycobacterium sp. 1164985.4]